MERTQVKQAMGSTGTVIVLTKAVTCWPARLNQRRGHGPRDDQRRRVWRLIFLIDSRRIWGQFVAVIGVEVSDLGIEAG